MSSRTIVLLAFFLLTSISASASYNGDVRLAAGIIIPRGNFRSYADEGPTFDLIGTLALGHQNPFSGWFGASGAFFKEDETYVPILFDNLLIDGKKVVSQYAISVNGGMMLTPQIGASSIRPYLMAGPGLYVFDTQTDWRIDDASYDNQDPLHREHQTQVKFGLRAGAGLNLYFSRKWGLGFKYLFDSVIDLHQGVEVDENRHVVTKTRNARFDSIMLEIVIPFATFRELGTSEDTVDED